MTSIVKVKALQKAEYSDFCIFAKFRTCFLPYVYSVYRILRHNQKFGISQKILIFGIKCLTSFLEQKWGFGSKNLYSVYTEFITSKLNSYFSKKLILTQIPTWIFEFKFGMQGPTCNGIGSSGSIPTKVGGFFSSKYNTRSQCSKRTYTPSKLKTCKKNRGQTSSLIV